MNTQTVPEPSENRPQPHRDTLGTVRGHFADTTENTSKPQVDVPPGTVGTLRTLTPPETDHRRGRCGHCGAELNPHNITGACAECKLIARNARMAGTPVDYTRYVTPEQAKANILAVFPNARALHKGPAL
jgi:hypothetical protein